MEKIKKYSITVKTYKGTVYTMETKDREERNRKMEEIEKKITESNYRGKIQIISKDN